MAQCFSACGCSDLEGVTRSDLDRYTDKIENVLNEENGRRIFRGFMITAKLKDGKRCLRLWEQCDEVATTPAADSADKKIYGEFLCEVDALIESAEKVDELDYAIMEKLTLTRDSEDKDEIITIIKLLKNEVTKAMKSEYQAFKRHFIKKRF